MERLRLDYTGNKMPLIEVAKKHRTGLGTIARLTRVHDWPRRRPNAHDPKIKAMKARKYFVMARMERDKRELERLDHKIRFLETLNA